MSRVAQYRLRYRSSSRSHANSWRESPAQSLPMLLKAFQLNGLGCVVAGNCDMKDELIAAGAHFGTDIVWHVLWCRTNYM